MPTQDSGSLQPVLNLEVPDLAHTAFVATWEHAARYARTVSDVRFEKMWELRRFEYQHFYSAWAGVAFRLRACSTHSAEYVEAFKQPLDEEPAGIATFAQDEALFGFFVKGLSVLECCCYGLYALGALATVTPPEYIPPSHAFPFLDPGNPSGLKGIGVESTFQAFEKRYRDASITADLNKLTLDPTYGVWKALRNILAHRAATAGRNQVYHSFPPFAFGGRPESTQQWAGGVLLTADITTANYAWLVTTINRLLADASRFAAEVFKSNDAPSAGGTDPS